MHALSALILAFTLAAAIAPMMIARLRALAVRQTAYADAPKTHQAKTGTPTMGGLLFLIGPLVALFFAPHPATFVLTLVTIGCGVVGMVDDLSAIHQQRNRGLSPRAKFLATIAVGLLFIIVAVGLHLVPLAEFVVPRIAAPAWLILGLSLGAILATTHAVNLTDGLDGLAAGTIVPPLAVFAWLAQRSGRSDVMFFDLALLGAVLGFMIYNRYPAKVFMGDVGALALGGALAGSAILSGGVLLLPWVGLVFVAEALSVILQVASFRSTGRRIFRMSPLHHHFELGGASEVQVTGAFWSVSIFCASIALLVIAR